jgi:oligopeptide transport system substrate-binding protein
VSLSRPILAALLALTLGGCALPRAAQPVAPEPTAPAATSAPARPTPTFEARPQPTATAVATPEPRPGSYVNNDLGVSLSFPESWEAEPGDEGTDTLVWIYPDDHPVVAALFVSPLPRGETLDSAAAAVHRQTTSELSDVEVLREQASKLADGRDSRTFAFRGSRIDGSPVEVTIRSAANRTRLFHVMVFGDPEAMRDFAGEQVAFERSLTISAPLRFGVPEDQALFYVGGESSNPRAYDPATGGGDSLVFSGLVAFDPQLRVTPDLAESWEIGADGTTYTFRLHAEARFHNGRPVTAEDVIWSWERAADPATESNTVLTYLGDIVGVRERRAGEASSIAGLRAVDERTLEVRIDAPKPYFVMKLAAPVAYVLDRANVEAGPEWHRTPNGTGPYRMARWERDRVQIYERSETFYGEPPAVRFVVVQLYAGDSLRMYEVGETDIAGVGSYSLDRMRDPREPLSADLVSGVDLCTFMVLFDVTRPPFDDQRVREAFALAVDRERWVEATARGVAVPARGLFPPGLPGARADLPPLDEDAERARSRLAESRFGGPEGLPPVVLTSVGFGGGSGDGMAVLAQMWRETLGVTVTIELLEPNTWVDMLHEGRHGNLISYGWCADYPDPENFADVLFHTGAQENLGGHTDAELDALLEQARVEQDVARRLELYQRAEDRIIATTPAIFLSHGLSYVLVSPRVEGYVLTPVRVPLERYLTLAPR